MRELIAPIARIAARYAAGALATYGVVADQGDLYLILATLIGAAVEGAYAVARRRGWAT